MVNLREKRVITRRINQVDVGTLASDSNKQPGGKDLQENLSCLSLGLSIDILPGRDARN